MRSSTSRVNKLMLVPSSRHTMKLDSNEVIKRGTDHRPVSGGNWDWLPCVEVRKKKKKKVGERRGGFISGQQSVFVGYNGGRNRRTTVRSVSIWPKRDVEE